MSLPYRFIVAFVFLFAIVAPASRAQNGPEAPDLRPTTKPNILDRVGIDQKLDAQVPLDLVFRDDTGATVRLGDYFTGQRPVILALVYYRCPMLCTMVLNDLTRTLVAMRGGNMGQDFDVVTVSFDPTETPQLAAAKKAEYVRAYRRPGAEKAWHFLTGEQASIAKLTDAVGFRYAWDENNKQFAHASGIMVLTPKGRVARYFYGVDYSPRDLRLSLTEASEGKIGTPVDQVLLYCFHYDPSSGRYSLFITRLLRVAAVITLVVLGSSVYLMSRSNRRQRLAASSPPSTSSPKNV